tara:strand:+ start:370 stop:1683 length:1314 start_codon:yes stop_codon:yes gene_type:complete
MKKLLFIILFTIPFIGFGQGWEKTFGGNTRDIGKSVQQTTDGGYIILGSKGYPNSDFWLIKTDQNGYLQWDQTFGSSSYDDEPYSVKQTNDGGYILTGRTRSFGGGTSDKIWLIKTDGNGVQQWDKLFYGGVGWSWGRDVQQTNDGGYIISGYTGSIGGEDVWLIKTDSQGNTLWDKTYTGENIQNHCYSVQQTTDGGYIMIGYTNTSMSGQKVWLIKTDLIGDTLWTNKFDGEFGRDVEQTTDGGYIIVGTKMSGYCQDLMLIKTNGNGTLLWEKFYNLGGGPELGNSVQQTTDGGYIMVGIKGPSCSGDSISMGLDYDLWLVKTDSQGDTIWTKTYGSLLNDYGVSVQQTNDGGYIMTGIKGYVFNSSSPGGDVWLIKTNSQGGMTWSFNIPTSSSNRKLEKVVDILGRETKPKPNTPFIEIYDDGTVDKKIVIE